MLSLRDVTESLTSVWWIQMVQAIQPLGEQQAAQWQATDCRQRRLAVSLDMPQPSITNCRWTL